MPPTVEPAVAEHEAPPPPTFPWPPAEDGSITEAVARTWVDSTFHPTKFFRGTPRAGKIGSALLYFLPLGVLVSGIDLFWGLILGPMDLGDSGALARFVARDQTTPLQDFLLSPVVLLLGLLVSSALTHLFLKLLGGAHHGLGTTVRVFCFAYSPALLAVIPRVGTLVGAVWIAVLGIIGLREAQETTTVRATAAVFFPVLLVVGFLALAVFLIVAGALLQPISR